MLLSKQALCVVTFDHLSVCFIASAMLYKSNW